MSSDVEAPRDRLETLLPFYLNGTLSDAERADVEEWLATDPAAAIALEGVEAEYSATALANEEISPPADALRRLSAALEREAGVERAGQVSLPQRVAGWFAALPPGLAWGTAAVALAILLAQSAWLRSPAQQDYTVAGTQQPAAPPSVLVSFSDSATIQEITETLQELELRIDSGPLPDGMYRVAIPVETNAEYDQKVARLQALPLVTWILAGHRPEGG